MSAEASETEHVPLVAPPPSGDSPAYVASPYSYSEARRLAADLGLAEPVAIALVRRGHRTVEEARAFLAAEDSHDPRLFSGIGEAVDLIGMAIDAGSRITVHGDYDVDGMCATAILVGTLRELGADCDWLIPDRSADGYGLGPQTAAKLRERGTELLITVDCGIASAAEVDELLAEGIEVVVTDHHQPSGRLPACPVVHPRLSDYPFPDLCGAAVAAKLAALLRGDPDVCRDLDLVALATIADMVPLVGENRALVKRGLAELRRGRRVGLRALMLSSRVEPEAADEGDVSFRIAPRLNAAGRLYRADAGVELMLCADQARAEEIAAELDAANHERRDTERAVYAEAEAAIRSLPEPARDAAAIVVAGAGWHPGVVGIVASRLVERHHKPAVVLALDGEGRAKGSGRAPAGYDLLAGLQRAAPHLDRFGGHRAAAGMELAEENVDAFRASLAEHAAASAPEAGFAEPQVVDAFVGAEALALDVAEQLGELGPFGLGNPAVKLLVPGARVDDVQEMGEGGRHARFHLRSGTARARGVAFNSAGRLSAARSTPHDLAVRLEVNRWNGVSEPRAVLADAFSRQPPPAAPGAGGSASSEVSHLCAGTGEEAWWRRFHAELSAATEVAVSPAAGAAAADLAAAWSEGPRNVVDARGSSALARVSELSSSGERVIVVTADAARRAALLGAGTGIGARCACLRCEDTVLSEAAADRDCGLLITDWTALLRSPQAVSGFEHLVLLDPPVLAAAAELPLQGAPRGGYLHLALAPAEELALPCWDGEWNLRPALAEIYKAVGGAGSAELAGDGLREALTGSGAFPRPPESGARCVRILGELGIAEMLEGGDAPLLRVVSSSKTELDRSGAWRAFQSTHQAGRTFLEALTTESRRSPSAMAS